jgi:hypothetical protein
MSFGVPGQNLKRIYAVAVWPILSEIKTAVNTSVRSMRTSTAPISGIAPETIAGKEPIHRV